MSSASASASPTIPLSDLSLFLATPEQIELSRKRTWEAWGRGRTLEDYLARDKETDMSEVGREGRLATWVLAKRSDPTGPDFVCSCETFKREGYVIEPPNTQGRKASCYGIASVFTSPAHRKKGYASHMMRLLHWVLAPQDVLPVSSFPVTIWGERPKQIEGHGGDAAFSVLYSDVGPHLYKACGVIPGEDGWVCVDPISTTWEVNTSPANGVINGNGNGNGNQEEWEWLDLDATHEMWKADAAMIKSEMDEMARNIGDHNRKAENVCTFLPDNGLADFQILRLRHFWGQFGLKHWGIRRGNAFASWTVDRNEDDGSRVLLVTRVRAGEEDFHSLVDVLVDYARKHGMRNVEIWGLPQNLRELGGKTWERDDHLPCLKSYGYGKEYKWHLNEKFAWC